MISARKLTLFFKKSSSAQVSRHGWAEKYNVCHTSPAGPDVVPFRTMSLCPRGRIILFGEQYENFPPPAMAIDLYAISVTRHCPSSHPRAYRFTTEWDGVSAVLDHYGGSYTGLRIYSYDDPYIRLWFFGSSEYLYNAHPLDVLSVPHGTLDEFKIFQCVADLSAQRLADRQVGPTVCGSYA